MAANFSMSLPPHSLLPMDITDITTATTQIPLSLPQPVAAVTCTELINGIPWEVINEGPGAITVTCNISETTWVPKGVYTTTLPLVITTAVGIPIEIPDTETLLSTITTTPPPPSVSTVVITETHTKKKTKISVSTEVLSSVSVSTESVTTIETPTPPVTTTVHDIETDEPKIKTESVTMTITEIGATTTVLPTPSVTEPMSPPEDPVEAPATNTAEPQHNPTVDWIAPFLIAIGVFLGLALVGGLGIFLWRRRARRAGTSDASDLRRRNAVEYELNDLSHRAGAQYDAGPPPPVPPH